ncbi:MAG: response regulator [Oligoflexia bacterium]|nr:response regulator [Oligoflexia bacterium]
MNANNEDNKSNKENKLVIIDDEKLLRERLKQLFELEDYTVFIAEDGPSGLACVEKEKPAVVVLDVKMPGMDGVEVLKKIKEMEKEKDIKKKEQGQKNIEVIMVTGHASMDTVVEILRLGAFDYIQKPVAFDELEIIVKRALEKQRLENELIESHIAQRELQIKHDSILESENRYKTLFDNFTDGVLILDIDEKRYSYANSAICEMLGYNISEFKSMNINNIYIESERERITKELSLLEDDHKKIVEDIPCLKKDSTIMYANINSKKIKLNDKSFQINIFRDITLRKQMQEEKDDMQKQLMITSRLASLGEMASGIAHEINNPLYIISLNIENLEGELLKHKLDQDQSIKNVVNAMTTSVTRITKIVNGLRSYTHFDESADKINLNDLIDASVSIVKSMYEKDCVHFDLQLDQTSTSTDLYGNWGLLQQVLLNFFSNAKYAMKHLAESKITITTKVLSDLVVLTVTDIGSGIPEDKLYKIFDPFFTTKPMGEGTGIGLNLVHSIINRMHGHIKVDSKVGSGTQFTVTFPSYKKSILLEDENKTIQNIKLQEDKGQVLIVDDEKDIRDLISILLKRVGYNIEVAENGMQALTKIKQKSFDIIITDISMPVMGGLEFITEASSMKLLEKTRVAFITGIALESYPEEQRKKIETFAKILIQKPFSNKLFYKYLESM